MKFTGERVVPGEVPLDLYREHISRYIFSSHFINSEVSLLDVGCGTGYGTKELSRKAANAIGIDISSEAIEYAQNKYSENNVDYRVMDCYNLQFELNSFDVVISFEVIEHLDNPDLYLENIVKVLKDNGTYIVSTPNKKMYSDSNPNYSNPFHIKEYYLDEFKRLLNKYFQNVDIYVQNYSQGILVKKILSEELSYQTVSLDENPMDPESSSFFVAVCSNNNLEKVNANYYEFSQSNIIAEKDKYIQLLLEEVKKRDESVGFIVEENKSKSEWIEKLKQEVLKRDSDLLDLLNQHNHTIQDNKEKTEWIEKHKEEMSKRDTEVLSLLNQHNFLIEENKVKTEWIERLQQEVSKRDVELTNLLEHHNIIINKNNSSLELIERLREESLKKEIQIKQNEDWIQKLQDEVRIRDESVEYLQNEIKELKTWVEQLNAEVVKRDETVLTLKKMLSD